MLHSIHTTNIAIPRQYCGYDNLAHHDGDIGAGGLRRAPLQSRGCGHRYAAGPSTRALVTTLGGKRQVFTQLRQRICGRDAELVGC